MKFYLTADLSEVESKSNEKSKRNLGLTISCLETNYSFTIGANLTGSLLQNL